MDLVFMSCNFYLKSCRNFLELLQNGQSFYRIMCIEKNMLFLIIRLYIMNSLLMYSQTRLCSYFDICNCYCRQLISFILLDFIKMNY